jgi:putative ABC transport system permease protein
MNPSPPKIARKLLLFFLKERMAEEVLGDLDEKFVEIAKTKSVRRAKVNYWYQVFNYIRPFAIRRTKLHNLIQLDMFKNYFTIGWRNMTKHKMYSAINIGGFALGIAACMLLALYIKGELSYDRHYTNSDRIYRVVGKSVWDGEVFGNLYFPHPFGNAVKESFPEIENVGYYNPVVNFGAGSNEVRRTDRPENTHEDGFAFMNQGMLEVLEIPFVRGNPSRALTEPNTIVITRKKAEKFFGSEDPIGKSLILNNDEKKVYTITGVVEDFSPYSHLSFDFMITLAGEPFYKGERDSWCCQNYLNYVLLRPGTDIAALEKKFYSVVDTYFLPDARKRSAGKDEMAWLQAFSFSLQPVSNIYLNREDYNDDLNHGDIRFIWLFGSIAVFILALACINFINLSTARSANRAREVGVRKAIGSLRGSIIRQFLTESFLFSVVALVLGILLAQLMIPAFNSIVGKSLVFPWTQWWLIPSLAAAALLIGFIAGIYPAYYLSAFLPAKVLKGGIATGARNVTMRSVLVVFQFTISIILIVGTIVISRQINYALNKELGFNKDRVLILHGTVTLEKQLLPFKNELLQLSDVGSVTISNYLPIEGGKRDGGSTTLEGMPDDSGISGQQWLVDHDYIKTMGLRIKHGRDFDARINSDSQSMIINELMARKLGLEKPIGARVKNYAGVFTIIGVVDDFHFQSVKQEIRPLSMFIQPSNNIISVKLSTTDMAGAIESVSATWKKFSPNQPVRFEFLDDRYARGYDDVRRFGLIVKIFATLAITVACLGLFALSAFMIEQRGKELSIRMILGAPVTHIFRLLSQNFVMLVTISFMIATPVAWFMMNQWLQDYAYKIDITWDVFAVTGVAALAIALLTISYQCIKASFTNPVANLKSE